MDYETAIAKMNIPAPGKRHLGLDTVSRLLALLDNPQEKYRTLHVAGTNGKGSTTYFLMNMLKMTGARVGTFTSPSLFEYNDRIQINGENITDERLIAISKKIRKTCLGHDLHPTEFEWATVVAFLYFYEENVDFAVIEVGLGGRLDSTNVLKKPEITLITHIGLDHQETLGDTIPKIASEKAGIIKDHRPVVIYPQAKEAEDVLIETANAHHSPIIHPDPTKIEVTLRSVHEQRFNYGALSDITMHTLGNHQFYNAITAMEAIFYLRHQGRLMISDEAIKTGIANTRWPGRFERLNDDPVILVDGAHNEQGMAALADSLKTYYPNQRIIGVTTHMRDKALDQMVPVMTPLISEFIVLSVQNYARSMSASEMHKEIAQFSDKPIIEVDSPEEALKVAIERAAADQAIILCYGSLYLVSDFRHAVGEYYHLPNL
ncbi:MAG: folylpolyglutamate synthase/dihydrofolate synthase family protein [Aerococcus sp.]|nr:folylpolyglutamate synthase/dihydrofolate synthase family protein [Aerococcus sp.]